MTTREGATMEFRWLQYALEVNRYRSFTKAAQALSVTQPSLSQQISKLERELGVALFYRGNGPTMPTPDGQRFFEQAGQIVQMSEDLLREMRERSQGMMGELTIGAPAITGGHVLPPVLRAYAMNYPDVRIHLVEESTDQLEELTAKGIIDLCILALPVNDARLEIRPMLTESLVLALPRERVPWMPDIVLDNNVPTALDQFAQAPFIVLKNGFGFRHTVLQLCAKSGFQPHVAFETSSVETAQSLAAHGLGVTVVPHMVMLQDTTKQSPCYVPIASQPSRTLVFAYRRDRYLGMTARALLDIYDELRDTLMMP